MAICTTTSCRRTDALSWATGALTATLYDYVEEVGGSFSAEHGIGIFRRDELARYKSPLALELMRKIKAAIDPNGIMNPGKIFQGEVRHSAP